MPQHAMGGTENRPFLVCDMCKASKHLECTGCDCYTNDTVVSLHKRPPIDLDDMPGETDDEKLAAAVKLATETRGWVRLAPRMHGGGK